MVHFLESDMPSRSAKLPEKEVALSVLGTAGMVVTVFELGLVIGVEAEQEEIRSAQARRVNSFFILFFKIINEIASNIVDY